MDGKSLSQHINTLDQAASDLGVRPLSECFSIAPEEEADFMEAEGMEMGDIELPPLQQFSAGEGLATVRALAAHSAARSDRVSRDLRDCVRILRAFFWWPNH